MMSIENPPLHTLRFLMSGYVHFQIRSVCKRSQASDSSDGLSRVLESQYADSSNNERLRHSLLEHQHEQTRGDWRIRTKTRGSCARTDSPVFILRSCHRDYHI
jgi:hypothetical protein